MNQQQGVPTICCSFFSLSVYTVEDCMNIPQSCLSSLEVVCVPALETIISFLFQLESKFEQEKELVRGEILKNQNTLLDKYKSREVSRTLGIFMFFYHFKLQHPLCGGCLHSQCLTCRHHQLMFHWGTVNIVNIFFKYFIHGYSHY